MRVKVYPDRRICRGQFPTISDLCLPWRICRCVTDPQNSRPAAAGCSTLSLRRGISPRLFRRDQSRAPAGSAAGRSLSHNENARQKRGPSKTDPGHCRFRVTCNTSTADRSSDSRLSAGNQNQPDQTSRDRCRHFHSETRGRPCRGDPRWPSNALPFPRS